MGGGGREEECGEGERAKYFSQSEISMLGSVQICCSFKTSPPPQFLFYFFPSLGLIQGAL